MGGLFCRAATAGAVAPDARDDDEETHPTVLLACLRAADSGEIELEGGSSCPPLAAFPPQLLCVAGLRVLALRKALLTGLPDAFGDSLPGLVELDLSDGHLATLPRSLGALQRLRKLTLFKNHLVALPDSLGACVALVELNVFDNRLTCLPPGIAGLERLEDVRDGGRGAHAGRARAPAPCAHDGGCGGAPAPPPRAGPPRAPHPAPCSSPPHSPHAPQLNAASNRLARLPRALLDCAAGAAAGHRGAAASERRGERAAAPASVAGAGSIDHRVQRGIPGDPGDASYAGVDDDAREPEGGGHSDDATESPAAAGAQPQGEGGAGEEQGEEAAADQGVVYRWIALKRLALHMNQLEALPDLTCASATLTQLQVNFNRLRRLPELGRAGSLAMIDASHNLIAELPSSGALAQLRSLASLSLKHNALSGTLAGGIGACGALETLNLEANPRLQRLPEELGGCCALKVLLLKDCGLAALPFELAQAPRLARLSFERTPLAHAMAVAGLGCSRSATHSAAASRQSSAAAPGAAGDGELEPPAAAPLSPRAAAQQVTLVRHLSSMCEAAGGWLNL